MPDRPRSAVAALGFALAALLACWSPLAAPFGLLTGLGATLLSVLALRAGRRGARLALGLALVASVGAGWVVARTAGFGRDPGDAPPVPTEGERETSRKLDAAGAPSRAERQRAGAQGDPGGDANPRN
jgi:hypothetical protein